MVMSDGNYNRNLLPYHNYQSGVRAGRAQMKAQALAALDGVLAQYAPGLDELSRGQLVAAFRKALAL